MAQKKVLIGITGGIAAYRSCDLISHLAKEGFEVRCVMTRGAQQFITPLTIETLSRNKVYTDAFESSDFGKSLHIALAEFAGLIIVIPATANMMAKVAHGLADDLLSSVILSATCPVVFAPAMNTEMWKNAATQENIETLKKRRYQFIDPVHGELSCGTTGIGHIAELNSILESIQNFL